MLTTFGFPNFYSIQVFSRKTWNFLPCEHPAKNFHMGKICKKKIFLQRRLDGKTNIQFFLTKKNPIYSQNRTLFMRCNWMFTESWVLTACDLICKKNKIVLVWHNQNGSWYICLLYNIAYDIQFLLTGRNLTKFGKFSRVLKLCSI